MLSLAFATLLVAAAEPPVSDEDVPAERTPLAADESPAPQAAPAPAAVGPGCVPDAERSSFCRDGTVWSAGPCEGGEYLVCERTHDAPNIIPTLLHAGLFFGLTAPPLFIAAALAAAVVSVGTLIRSFDSALTDVEKNRLRVASGAVGLVAVIAPGIALSILIAGVTTAYWVWRQGLEVVLNKEGSGFRYTLHARWGFERSSPLASFRSRHEPRCHDEIVRLAAEDHFFKVAEIWAMRTRSLLAPFDPWKGLPRLPDRTPASQRMTPAKCQAQIAAGEARIRAAAALVIRTREEMKELDKRAHDDMRACAMRTSTCTCNCESQGGAGGKGGNVGLGEKGTPDELMTRLSEVLGPPVKVVDKDGFIQVPLKELVLFDVDKDTLTPAAWATLARAANVLAEHPDVRIIVEGHASAPGGKDYNQDLSTRRAKAVERALGGLGVAKARITVAAFGTTQPEVPTDREEARNRRVLIRLQAEPPRTPEKRQPVREF